jgi:hypothetical protein
MVIADIGYLGPSAMCKSIALMGLNLRLTIEWFCYMIVTIIEYCDARQAILDSIHPVHGRRL